MINAIHATLAHSLGLSSRDLAEIGGFSERFARDLLAGRRPIPRDVCDALEDIQDDVYVMADAIEADAIERGGDIFVYATNADLRAQFPLWPGRGCAGGGFIGPHQIAALGAWDDLHNKGADANILLFGG